jgi:hypothetical protein
VYNSKMINSIMPCGFRGCDYNLFCVDQKTLAHLQCVELICFSCRYRRQLSLEYFELMVELKRRVIIDRLFNNKDWNEESIRKMMMQYNNMEDMK